jgi:hypothetical protein
MKTLVAIVISGMVVIATALGFMMMQHEMKWKDAEITKLKKNQEDTVKIRAELKKAQREALSYKEAAQKLAISAQNLVDSHKTLNNLQNQKINILESSLRDSKETPTSHVQVASPQFQIPRWIPQPATTITKSIKDKALAKYGSNYSSANYHIEREGEAYEKLVRYQKMNNVFVSDLLNKTMFERGDDYTGAIYEIERQIEAKQKLQSR